MSYFIKVVNPCFCQVGSRERKSRAYVQITYKDGRLSFTGVIGPKSNGNCVGPSGQISDELRKGLPTAAWNSEMLNQFCDIWDEWHLNDMRPYCKHQKQLGWPKMAKHKVSIYHYKLNNATIKIRSEAEKSALTALKDGRVFTPTAEQVAVYNLEQYISLPNLIEQDEAGIANFYEPDDMCCGRAGVKGFIENEILGHLREDEHPKGILKKSCPICGYQYGTGWQTEPVPEHIIDWLKALPDSKSEPAWI